MSEDWIIITEAAKTRLRIGEVVETREFFVDDRLLKKYQMTLRDPNPLYWDDEYAKEAGAWGERVCPSGMVLALNPMEHHPSCCPASAFWAARFQASSSVSRSSPSISSLGRSVKKRR